MISAKKNRGSISIFVLVFGVVFATVSAGMVMFAAIEHTGVIRSESSEQALTIAEAGVNYYKWHLVHDPDDYQDGTGLAGPYVHTYEDQSSSVVGSFSLEIVPPEEGSDVVTVTSTGWTTQEPGIRRTVTARYGPVSLTQFSFFHNANVWFGQGITIDGEVFSNGGIRMDGTNTSVIGSSKETYTCGIETGCVSPETKPGVWGNGGPQELWEYPVPVFDFDSIVTDFAALKSEAQANGVYLPTTSSFGYHLVFSSDGRVDVYEVTSADVQKGWEVEEGCIDLYQIIDEEQFVGNYPIDGNKVFYAEDTLWVDGTFKGKTTVVAARLPVQSFSSDIWITDNLVYESKDISNSLGLVAQRDIIFGLDIPKKFYVEAALLAQNGRVIRHKYSQSGCVHSNKSNRLELNIYGSIISNKKSYWNFSGPQGPTSGFTKRTIIYNPDAAVEPPPLFPTQNSFELLSWEEVD